MERVLIIDSSGLCHRAKHAMRGLQLSFNEMRTDIIYSFLAQVLSISEELECPNLVFVWDSKMNIRKQKFPFYKVRPKVDDEELEEINKAVLPQFQKIRCSIVPSLGFKNNYIRLGFEADDLIASIVMHNPKYEKIIVSRDNDLLQLLEYADMYDFQTKKRKTYETFKKKWGIEPFQWADVKAIAGCVTDTVPGIDRVGEKTACKYILGELKTTYKAYQSIKDGKKIIDRNRQIVKLPYMNTPVIKIKNSFKLECMDFFEVFEKHGMESFMTYEMTQRWQNAFNLLE